MSDNNNFGGQMTSTGQLLLPDTNELAVQDFEIIQCKSNETVTVQYFCNKQGEPVYFPDRTLATLLQVNLSTLRGRFNRLTKKHPGFRLLISEKSKSRLTSLHFIDKYYDPLLGGHQMGGNKSPPHGSIAMAESHSSPTLLSSSSGSNRIAYGAPGGGASTNNLLLGGAGSGNAANMPDDDGHGNYSTQLHGLIALNHITLVNHALSEWIAHNYERLGTSLREIESNLTRAQLSFTRTGDVITLHQRKFYPSSALSPLSFSANSMMSMSNMSSAAAAAAASSHLSPKLSALTFLAASSSSTSSSGYNTPSMPLTPTSTPSSASIHNFLNPTINMNMNMGMLPTTTSTTNTDGYCIYTPNNINNNNGFDANYLTQQRYISHNASYQQGMPLMAPFRSAPSPTATPTSSSINNNIYDRYPFDTPTYFNQSNNNNASSSINSSPLRPSQSIEDLLDHSHSNNTYANNNVNYNTNNASSKKRSNDSDCSSSSDNELSSPSLLKRLKQDPVSLSTVIKCKLVDDDAYKKVDISTLSGFQSLRDCLASMFTNISQSFVVCYHDAENDFVEINEHEDDWADFSKTVRKIVIKPSLARSSASLMSLINSPSRSCSATAYMSKAPVSVTPSSSALVTPPSMALKNILCE
ncbi:hypothetical protein SAMD00019534_096350 [Acytostelium subglobosum LB1]|uniref:hypothetical protein n=1 Tax=Acytostelium subglobosum LB1 TaxID=1410327 RepID=UPI000644AF62|nr:hypothetical protein SAMD00019534_096350 [Acytostelium subglobosum LB1]GAM26460.1 hypothetical protein SAMD00019534_096350 [Acytostelium subglobosum LB1]|eukprot:XP_012750556.1 hypothetical protein SAMD00019534_096350 [Acytostelium subglobosum LB1]